MKQTFLFLIIFISFISKIGAQDEVEETPTSATVVDYFPTRRFTASAALGFNAAQINGDFAAGYTKMGLWGGIRANVVLTPKKYVSTGIYYSQRGSQPRLSKPFWTINLNMIEVPLILTYKDMHIKEDFYRTHVGAGLTYGRLISSKATDSALDGFEDKFRTNNLSWVAEVTMYANKHLGFGFRYNRALQNLFTGDITIKDPITQKEIIKTVTLKEHWLNLNMVYTF